ncbi:ribokinase [Devosia sp. YR412]|uniref:ribokinase n=1 Tax=Devosia sp. YR412 TaxID=1881030 RepID=UPI0008C46F7B|nr:ribokinase [Devosia sp. YR412]SEP73813.1 ribokinase [Devosia sp. YR412]
MPISSPVIVLGSLHYDIIVHGPGRPRKGETVTGTAWAPKCGGKGGNQAVSAARAGAPVRMIGAVGDDDFGTALLGNLTSNKVDVSALAVLPGETSGMSVAIFDGEGDYGAVIVSGSNLKIDPTALSNQGWDAGSWLVLQSEVPEPVNLAGARLMQAAGGKVVLNAAPARPVAQEVLDLVDILVVNAIEAEMLAATPVVETLAGAMAAAIKLLERSRAVVVTAGGEGCAYADRSGQRVSIPAKKIVVASTHGAGDEFIGALTAALWRGLDIEAALNAANEAAALLVSTPEDQR